MTNITEQTELKFFENVKSLPFVASRFNYFESHGKADFLFPYDEHEADISADVSGLADKDLMLKAVKFTHKDMSAEALLPQQLINNTSFDLLKASHENLTPRFMRKYQSQAFGRGNVNGLGDTQMQDIFQYNNYANKIENIKIFTDFNEMLEDFMMNPLNLKSAILVVNHPSVARNFKDKAGNVLFKGHVSETGIIGTVENIPVMVQDLNGKGLAVLMRGDAYAVAVNGKSVRTETITGDDDTELARKGAVSVFAAQRSSGMVVNPAAIKILIPAVATASIGDSIEVENSATEEPVEAQEVVAKSTEVENPVVKNTPKKKTTRKVKGE